MDAALCSVRGEALPERAEPGGRGVSVPAGGSAGAADPGSGVLGPTAEARSTSASTAPWLTSLVRWPRRFDDDETAARTPAKSVPTTASRWLAVGEGVAGDTATVAPAPASTVPRRCVGGRCEARGGGPCSAPTYDGAMDSIMAREGEGPRPSDVADPPAGGLLAAAAAAAAAALAASRC